MAIRTRRPDRICGQCFNPFWPKAFNRLSFCSRQCAFNYQKDRAAERQAIKAAAQQFRYWAQAEQRRAKNARHCPRCSVEIGKFKQYCDDCRPIIGAEKRAVALTAYKQTDAYRQARRNAPSRRAGKAYRKALERGRLPNAERFDPLEVLARDGWRCHICGVATPKRLRGSFDDRAPELDHIVPLAAGGEHTRRNTACACRKCNISKGAMPLGQLRLVA